MSEQTQRFKTTGHQLFELQQQTQSKDKTIESLHERVGILEAKLSTTRKEEEWPL